MRLIITMLFSCIGILSSSQSYTYQLSDQKQHLLADAYQIYNQEIILIEEVGYCRNTRVSTLNDDLQKVAIVNLYGKLGTYEYFEFDNATTLVFTTIWNDDVSTNTVMTVLHFENDSVTSYEYTLDSEEDVDHIAMQGSTTVVCAINKTLYQINLSTGNITSTIFERSFEFLKSCTESNYTLCYKPTEIDSIYFLNASFDVVGADNFLYVYDEIFILRNHIIVFYEGQLISYSNTPAVLLFETNRDVLDLKQKGSQITYYTESPIGKTLHHWDFQESGITSDSMVITDFADESFSVHWNRDLRGYSFSERAMLDYEDSFRGVNSTLVYTKLPENPTPNFIDVMMEIENVEVDLLSNDIDLHFDLKVTNNSQDTITYIDLQSRAVEGINCAFNQLIFEALDSQILPGGSAIVEASYLWLQNGYPAEFCLYSIAPNHQYDPDTDNNISCVDLTDIIVSTIEMESGSPLIYPNPATNMISIVGQFSTKDIIVSDLMGRRFQVLINGNSLDISELPRGVYTIQLGAEVTAQRFLKL